MKTILGEPYYSQFWEKVKKTDTCWLWVAGKRPNGYGLFRMGTNWKSRSAHNFSTHRLAYEILIGPIPAELTLDHLCRVRHCVNPNHLEPVTMKENLLRGESIQAKNARKETCKRGHKRWRIKCIKRNNKIRYERLCIPCSTLERYRWLEKNGNERPKPRGGKAALRDSVEDASMG